MNMLIMEFWMFYYTYFRIFIFMVFGKLQKALAGTFHNLFSPGEKSNSSRNNKQKKFSNFKTNIKNQPTTKKLLS